MKDMSGVMAGLVIIMVMVPCSMVLAGGAQSAQEALESSLITDLGCNNCTVRQDAIYQLGEMGSDRAVIPLLSVLHNDAQESSRIVAALALCRIGDARGTYAVKRAATFDESAKVRMTCAWFYYQYVQEGSFQFSPVREGEPVVSDVLPMK